MTLQNLRKALYLNNQIILAKIKEIKDTITGKITDETQQAIQSQFTNKSILDKFTETADGKLLFNGVEVCMKDITIETEEDITEE